MSWFLLGLVIGLFTGFIGGLFYYAKKVHKHITTEELTRETINSIIMGDEPTGNLDEETGEQVAEILEDGQEIILQMILLE